MLSNLRFLMPCTLSSLSTTVMASALFPIRHVPVMWWSVVVIDLAQMAVKLYSHRHVTTIFVFLFSDSVGFGFICFISPPIYFNYFSSSGGCSIYISCFKSWFNVGLSLVPAFQKCWQCRRKSHALDWHSC